MSGGLLLPGNLADKSSATTQTYTGDISAPALGASGLTGASAASRYVGATTSGAPTTGTFALGDFIVDQTGTVWVCTVAGTPGTWKQITASSATTVTTIPNLTGDVTSVGNTTTLANTAGVQSVIASNIPSGSVWDYAGATAPTGWLLCAGSAVSRTTYAALFAVIGTTYGAGDGSTTFNLPDLRGRTSIGATASAGSASGATSHPLGQTPTSAAGGEETHTLATAEIPSHNHGGGTGTGSIGATSTGDDSPDHNHTQSYYNSELAASGTVLGGMAPGVNNVLSGQITGGASVRHQHPIPSLTVPSLSISLQGGGGAHNIMQPFTALNKIIKT